MPSATVVGSSFELTDDSAVVSEWTLVPVVVPVSAVTPRVVYDIRSCCHGSVDWIIMASLSSSAPSASTHAHLSWTSPELPPIRVSGGCSGDGVGTEISDDSCMTPAVHGSRPVMSVGATAVSHSYVRC